MLTLLSNDDVHMEGSRADNAPARGLDTQLAHPENTRRAFVPTDYFRNGCTRHSVFFFSFSHKYPLSPLKMAHPRSPRIEIYIV